MITACGPDCGWCGHCTRGPRRTVCCGDCGAEFAPRREDGFLIGALCDWCCDQRDAHTSALEERLRDERLLRMASAALPFRQKKESA